MPKWAEWRRKKDAMTRGLKHMLNRDLSRGFGAWVEMREERLAFMQTLKGLRSSSTADVLLLCRMAR